MDFFGIIYDTWNNILYSLFKKHYTVILYISTYMHMHVKSMNLIKSEKTHNIFQYVETEIFLWRHITLYNMYAVIVSYTDEQRTPSFLKFKKAINTPAFPAQALYIVYKFLFNYFCTLYTL